MPNRARLYFHTLRHLQPGQVVWRGLARLRKKLDLPRLPATPNGLQVRFGPVVEFRHHDAGNTSNEIRQGRFRFLNRTEDLGRPVDWNCAGTPLLWKFNLHYFQYLYLLDRNERESICLDWIRSNPVGRGAGWHPYPTSLRIVNWCKSGLDSPELLRSLYLQAAYLNRNIEWYHPGNHLLENAKALVIAGLYFRGQGEADRWLEKGLSIFRRETPIQVLSDGGYFERSPMYHAIILEGYLDILNVLPPEHEDRSLLIDAARRMSDFLASVVHPNGEIALFNDAARGIALPAKELLGYVERLLGYGPRKKSAFDETGVFVHESQDLYLIIDGGPVGPDFLPAHAHADIFSYELSLRSAPIIVDSGVFEYAAGEMRRYSRSTRAHNTVCIDGLDQAECWDSFRVARRFPPRNVAFATTESASQFSGEFSGYSTLIGDGIIHRREIVCDETRRQVTVGDHIAGAGIHNVESLIHLHPDVSIEVNESIIVLKKDQQRCSIRINENPFTIEDGWYFPEFGLKLRNKVIVIGGKHPLPARISYTISY